MGELIWTTSYSTVVPDIELASTRMLPFVRGLLMPLLTLMLLRTVPPVDPPSRFMPAVTLWYTLPVAPSLSVTVRKAEYVPAR